MFLNIEIKTAKKLNKPIYYFINSKDNNLKKYKDVIVYDNKEDYANKVKDLLDNLNISQSTLSHHMKILCESGVVNSRKEGKWTYYSISTEGSSYAGELLKKLTTINTDKYFKEYKCNI